MAIDFPNSPTTNQTYTVGATTWTYDGEKWVITASGRTGPSAVTVSDTAPTSPSYGTFWYNSSNGRTYTYYADADSAQWVEVGSADPTFNTLTTKGDILTRSSTSMARQAIGTDGQVLTADSTQANGMKWGGALGLEIVSTGTISNQTSFDITGFTSSYSLFKVVLEIFRTSGSGSSSTTATVVGGSTVYTSGYYGGGWYSAYNAGNGTTGVRNNGADMLMPYVVAQDNPSRLEMTVGGMNSTQFQFSCSGMYYDMGVSGPVMFGYQNTTKTTALDKIRFTNAVGMSGGWRVYGYRNTL